MASDTLLVLVNIFLQWQRPREEWQWSDPHNYGQYPSPSREMSQARTQGCQKTNHLVIYLISRSVNFRHIHKQHDVEISCRKARAFWPSRFSPSMEAIRILNPVEWIDWMIKTTYKERLEAAKGKRLQRKDNQSICYFRCNHREGNPALPSAQVYMSLWRREMSTQTFPSSPQPG